MKKIVVASLMALFTNIQTVNASLKSEKSEILEITQSNIVKKFDDIDNLETRSDKKFNLLFRDTRTKTHNKLHFSLLKIEMLQNAKKDSLEPSVESVGSKLVTLAPLLYIPYGLYKKRPFSLATTVVASVAGGWWWWFCANKSQKQATIHNKNLTNEILHLSKLIGASDDWKIVGDKSKWEKSGLQPSSLQLKKKSNSISNDLLLKLTSCGISFPGNAIKYFEHSKDDFKLIQYFQPMVKALSDRQKDGQLKIPLENLNLFISFSSLEINQIEFKKHN